MYPDWYSCYRFPLHWAYQHFLWAVKVFREFSAVIAFIAASLRLFLLLLRYYLTETTHTHIPIFIILKCLYGCLFVDTMTSARTWAVIVSVSLHVCLRLHVFLSRSVFIFKFKFHNKLHKINKDFRLGGIRYRGLWKCDNSPLDTPRDLVFMPWPWPWPSESGLQSAHSPWQRGGDDRPALSWSSFSSSSLPSSLSLSLSFTHFACGTHLPGLWLWLRLGWGVDRLLIVWDLLQSMT